MYKGKKAMKLSLDSGKAELHCEQLTNYDFSGGFSLNFYWKANILFWK